MIETVGVAQLRQNLSTYLRRIADGERFVITDRNRPVGSLGPPPDKEDPYERLVAEGVIKPGRRSGRPFQPVMLDDAGRPLSEIIDELREERL